jgi:hypothetical protein
MLIFYAPKHDSVLGKYALNMPKQAKSGELKVSSDTV